MKRNLLLGSIAFAALLMLASSCGSKKSAVVESRITKETSLEGENVMVESTKLSGTEMLDGLNEDGTKIVKVPFKWYAGIGTANDKQTAFEIAEREAYARISHIIEDAVLAESERGSVVNNTEVQKAIKLHWKQVSSSIQKGCEPLGDAKIEYSPSKKVYTVTAKVGIRGDRFQKLLNSAGDFKPSTLSGDDLQKFIDTNQAIMNAAKGN